MPESSCALPADLLRTITAAVFVLAVTVSPRQVRAQAAAGSATWGPQVLGTQIDVIAQRLLPLHSPYAGPNSLPAGGDAQVSHAYGVYLGQRVSRTLHAYLDVEMVRGSGVGHTVGLAGITNGDVIRQGSTDLGEGPYVARAFLRYTLMLGGTARDTLMRAPDQLADVVASTRLEAQAGKFALSDLFDANRYANSTRTQFMNWALFQNTAWDFAADTRGYTNGVAVSLLHTWWTLRAGSFQMPRQANGNVFDSDTRRARGDNVELTLSPPRVGTVVRLLAYENHARMGDYAEALARARVAGATPDIVADDRPGRTKWGWGVNLEQPLADSGETGAFVRLGWSDGRNESFAFTEVDRHLSAGVQLAGAHWHRAADHFAIAAVRHGIVGVHQQYLAAGGQGFLLGDGALRYGAETITEAYYRAQVGAFTQVSPDLQLIRNPGYNRDRGPVTVLGLRVNLRY